MPDDNASQRQPAKGGESPQAMRATAHGNTRRL
jgi:hypothetical protein